MKWTQAECRRIIQCRGIAKRYNWSLSVAASWVRMQVRTRSFRAVYEKLRGLVRRDGGW